VNPWLVGIAFAVTIGALIAVSARENRAALVGLAVVLGATPFLGDPLPQLSTLAARVVGGVLAAYLLRASMAPARTGSDVDEDPAQRGAGIGWPAEALLAIAAWLVGVSISARLEVLLPTGPGVPPENALALLTPSALGTAVGLASVVVAIVPALVDRHELRSVIGGLILLNGVLLLRGGVAGTPGDLEQLAGVALLVALAVAGSVLVSRGARRRAVGARTAKSDGDGNRRVTGGPISRAP